MITSYSTRNVSRLIVSFASVRRLFSLGKHQAVRVEVWYCGIVHVVADHLSRFVSLKTFKQHFVTFRKESASCCVGVQTALNRYSVKHEGLTRAVTLIPGKGLTCTCEDYAQQVSTFGVGCCKHGYKALGMAGFDSLASYVKATR